MTEMSSNVPPECSQANHRANPEHSIFVALLVRLLSFRAAHANARSSSRGDDPKQSCASAQTCWRVSETRAMFLSEAQESLGAVSVHTALNTNAKIVASRKELVDRFRPDREVIT